jgi:hypothetical protein
MKIYAAKRERSLWVPHVRRTSIYSATDLNNRLYKALQWEERSTAVGGGHAYNGRHVALPTGVWEIGGTVDLARTIPQENLSDQQAVVLSGEGYGNTVLKVVETNTTLFNMRNLRINMSGLQLEGNTDGTSTFAVLGDKDASTPIFQSSFRDLFLTNFNKVFQFGQIFDSIFDNIFILALKGTTPIIFDFLPHFVDNCNNLQFNRIHVEQAANATFVKSRSSLGANQWHHNIRFYGSHFETRAYNTKMVDLEGMKHSKFEAMFNRNNTSPTGDGLTYLDSAPIITAKDCYNIKFTGALQHVGTTHADTPKLIRVEGGSKGIVFEDMFMATGLTETSPGIDDIVDNAGSVPTEDAVLFRNVIANDQTNAPLNSAHRVSGHSAGNNTFGWDVVTNVAGTEDYVLEFSNSTNGQTKTAVARVHRAGMMMTGPIAAHTQVSMTDDSTTSYSIPNPDSGNNSKRGIYKIFGNTSEAGVVAEIYSNGAEITIGYAGAKVSCASGGTSTTNPDVDGNLNIYLVGSTVTLKNRLGATKVICIQAIGCGADD